MLRVFEAFSGVGAQRMALRNLQEDFEVVATSDIDESAILAYYYVHKFPQVANSKASFLDKKKYLIDKGIYTKSSIEKISAEKIDILYNAMVTTNNLGDITKIDVDDIPPHDLFTYSFPCQDISSVGKNKGLDLDSGTRSSLLWECRKIIEKVKPKYLLLENVKNLTTGKNKKNFELWLNYLKEQGYDNYWKIFDAKDYGIPQRRPRVIVVSKYGKSHTDLIKDHDVLKKDIMDIIDLNEKTWVEFKPRARVSGKIGLNDYAFLDDRDWKMNGVMISKLCSTQRAGRNGLKIIKDVDGQLFERKLNALECCRLMGFDDQDYYNMKKGNLTDAKIMRICGNSIVVNVLENIFKNIFEEENYD